VDGSGLGESVVGSGLGDQDGNGPGDGEPEEEDVFFASRAWIMNAIPQGLSRWRT
jgi:hypothetical protein